MHLTLGQLLNQPGVTVLGGILRYGVIGLIIWFYGIVTGEKYLEIWMDEVVLQLL